ncbi:hypothetical protein [Salicibibacter kimchii]|nr:hypothetical protein [Salicibibacter kimchii]
MPVIRKQVGSWDKEDNDWMITDVGEVWSIGNQLFSGVDSLL